MAASVSSSSSGFGTTLAFNLYDINFKFVALVDLPVQSIANAIPQSPPMVVTYLGQTYAWSYVHNAYIQTTPVAAQADLGAPLASPLCNSMG